MSSSSAGPGTSASGSSFSSKLSPGVSSAVTSFSNFSVSSCVESVLEGEKKAEQGGRREEEGDGGDGQVGEVGGGGGGGGGCRKWFVVMNAEVQCQILSGCDPTLIIICTGCAMFGDDRGQDGCSLL